MVNYPKKKKQQGRLTVSLQITLPDAIRSGISSIPDETPDPYNSRYILLNF